MHMYCPWLAAIIAACSSTLSQVVRLHIRFVLCHVRLLLRSRHARSLWPRRCRGSIIQLNVVCANPSPLALCVGVGGRVHIREKLCSERRQRLHAAAATHCPE